MRASPDFRRNKGYRFGVHVVRKRRLPHALLLGSVVKFLRHSCESRNPGIPADKSFSGIERFRIPAFAGMTESGLLTVRQLNLTTLPKKNLPGFGIVKMVPSLPGEGHLVSRFAHQDYLACLRSLPDGFDGANYRTPFAKTGNQGIDDGCGASKK